MTKSSKGKELQDKLSYKKKNFWKISSEKEREHAFVFADEYCTFIDEARTERLSVELTEQILKTYNFLPLTSDSSKKTPGFYRINRDKNIAIFRAGKKDISEGCNFIVAHIDVPRVDLKQVPLSEDGTTQLGIMLTHYYGGIRKYQWMAIPLALYGVVIKEDGTRIDISIGEKDGDPVFTFADLLPHLAKDYRDKKMSEAIDADKLQLLFGSIPFPDDEIKDNVKLNCLNILHEKYGITEEDFISAEIEIVPAFSSKDVGIDASMVGAYGQDDRVCSYTALRALLDSKDPALSSIVFLADKEEVGSEGNTGARSDFILDFIADIIEFQGYDSSKILRKVLAKTNILSGDVTAAINPSFKEVHEKQNAPLLGSGVCLTKFTGSRGKSGSNDAHPEFIAKLRKLFNSHHVNWQVGELGKVDVGGGGTIAKFMAEYNAEVIDCGTPILAMHSPFEISSKGDIYSTYKAYKIFFNHYGG
ncbi:MAG: aminopeptidase [Candidatus Celaenobacter antarcticus]|nr:aminopeptidase [Candidatus Celaenobacter antarcticus]MDP8315271.1 aminopeptidase [Candidatus Celaenobacter antarcticus]